MYTVMSRFCPFRFIQGRQAEAERAATLGTADASFNTGMERLRPQMFGFGRHMCPGRELAKLEILLFLRTFLHKFDYDLVHGQVSDRQYFN